MAVSRSAASKIDWTRLGSQLGLKGATLQSLTAFKKRNDDARRRVQLLSDKSTTVDFSHYRGILKNQAVVDDMEKQLQGFQVKKYDVARQLKAIEAFESQAVKSAEETKGRVQGELKSLEETLGNIESAKAFEELTIDEMIAAKPEIDEKASQLVAKGKWDVPGYKGKFGELSLL